MNARISSAAAGLSLLALSARAGTEVSLWHSYTPPSGETHHAFYLSNYKRGIFFGSCGPSTKALQWSFAFDLKGPGPRFTPDQIEIKDNRTPGGPAILTVSGEIVVDEKAKRVRIELKVPQGGATNDFIGNGTFKLREEL